MCKEAGILQKLISLCSRHGYIHSSVDHGRLGANGCYDYGPLGALLRRNILNEWWASVVSSQEDMYEIESTQLRGSNNETINDSNDSSTGSNDQQVSHAVPASSVVSAVSPKREADGDLEVNDRTSDNKNERRRDWLLRDSLHQGTFAQYYNTLQLLNRRLPFGLAQIGRCFQRTDQSDLAVDADKDRFIFDLPEFTQMTAQFYCSPKMADRWMIDWQRDRLQWWRKRNYSKGSTPPGGGTSCGNVKFPQRAGLRLDPKYAECNAVNPLTQREAVALERATIGQAHCIHWFDTREKRLTASLFGKVMKRKKAINSKFLMSLFGSNSSADRSASVIYGKNHEAEAKEVYAERNRHLHVHDCGFVVNPAFSFLGASPDGKVCDGGQTGILEIKCPYSARGMGVEEAASSLPQFYMVESCNGGLTLKKNHDYYYQVQGQLLVTGAPFCDFVVFTDRGIYVERILPDVELWETMLDRLAQFYQTHAVPFFIDQGM